MTRTENMSRKTYLTAAEVVEGWHGNAGRFLIAHPTWTFNGFTSAVDDLRASFHTAFGKMYLAGQHPADYDDARDVEMSEAAHGLYLEIQWDEASN